MDFFIETGFINPQLTLMGGQAFRFAQKDEHFCGVAGSRAVRLRFEENGIHLLGINEFDLPFWLEYFDIHTDYEAITARFSEDETMKAACKFARGLRILKQEPFETLISFIISQNNNIKRITGIIGRLCENFGEKISSEMYAFPSAETLAVLEPEALAPIRAGFRAKYIIDAARKVHSGEIDLNALYELTAENARLELMKIKGVGEKVADCVLLFAYGKSGAFPKDVWIKRASERFYPDGLPECISGYEGIAQQYLFEYIRNFKDTKVTEESLCSVQSAATG